MSVSEMANIVSGGDDKLYAHSRSLRRELIGDANTDNSQRIRFETHHAFATMG